RRCLCTNSHSGLPGGGCSVIDAWRADYNAIRPHTSLNGMTPETFAQHANKAYSNPQTLTQN
ncbi:transposase, partial [Gluconacetobacter azotocaptans]|uniref:transposase n=1 Tax=Gluconacetobacter azotocaptans TaxID=142834 RepID=UPI0022323D8E